MVLVGNVDLTGPATDGRESPVTMLPLNGNSLSWSLDLF